MVHALAFAWWFQSLPVSLPAVSLQPVEGIRAAAPQEGSARARPKVVTPAMVAAAEAFLSGAYRVLPIGSEKDVTIGGKHYALVLEWHYHPPGFVGAPNGWHRGVTVYEIP